LAIWGESTSVNFGSVGSKNFYKGWISEIRFQIIFPFLRDIPRMKILDVITAYCFLSDIPGVKISDAITIDC
jgi:hypothetical protein